MTQWWIWVLLLGSAGIWVGGVIYQVGSGHPFGNKPLSNNLLLFSLLIPFGAIIFFHLLTLKTEVGPAGITIRYFPMWSTFVSWKDVQSSEIIKYNFVGYGIRFSNDYGTVYNAKGNRGLLLQKADGKKLLIGTQLPEQLGEAVAKFSLVEN